jgi:hypothetical protein
MFAKYGICVCVFQIWAGICIKGFGSALRSARKRRRLSGKWMVHLINGYLVPQGIHPISLNTYYSWEKIGTPLEHGGRGYPHPSLYRLFSIVLDIDIASTLSIPSSDRVADMLASLGKSERDAIYVIISAISRSNP